MATETVSNAQRELEERCHLAVQALCQVRALMPLAMKLAEQCEDPIDDALLGLLGRVCDMNHVALNLIVRDPETTIEGASVEVLGRAAKQRAKPEPMEVADG